MARRTPTNPLEAAVRHEADGTWTFECPNVAGSPCGIPDGPGFTSSGWPDKSHALDRGRQHFDEHLGKGVAQEMADFMADRGLTTNPDGRCVKLEDLA